MFNEGKEESGHSTNGKVRRTGSVPTSVGEAMTREIKTVRPDHTLGEVVKLLAGNNFHHVLVANNDCLMGVLSDRDVFRQLGASDWTKRTVGEIMTTNVMTVGPQERLADAARQMLSARVNCLPVVSNGQLLGLLTSTDILRRFEDLQDRFEALSRIIA